MNPLANYEDQSSIVLDDDAIVKSEYNSDAEDSPVTSRDIGVFRNADQLNVQKIDEGSNEYDILGKSLAAGTGKKVKVVGAYKKRYDWSVIDEARLAVFRVFAAAVACRNGGDANIKYGWYGGSRDEIREILMYGFRRFDNGGLSYGRGVYLSPANCPMQSFKMPETSTDTTTAPLLRPRHPSGDSPSGSRPNALSLLLGRASGRHGASMLVRETAARQLEASRADWSYSKPVVALDLTWNLAFVAVSVVMMICTLDEKPNVPVRVWICGYSLQCAVHVVLVWLEYRRRNRRSREDETVGESDSNFIDSDDDEEVRIGAFLSSNRISYTKRCENLNTMISFVWWLIGFYWMVSGGETLLHHAPHLYWLTVVFLAFDVFFAIFCVVLACLIGIALCCCLPCIIAILYAVAGQEGASEADLNVLPKYKFQASNDNNDEKPDVGAGRMIPVESNAGYMAVERVLLPEDADCCICLSTYEDGAELHSLPCNHHFHAACIVKWLKMNATCPLCKYNILKGNEQV